MSYQLTQWLPLKELEKARELLDRDGVPYLIERRSELQQAIFTYGRHARTERKEWTAKDLKEYFEQEERDE